MNISENVELELADGKLIRISSEGSILTNAAQHGVSLEHSCKTGRCGVCKVQVSKGVTKILQHEESLCDSDIAEGYVLTCCRGAMTDLRIDAEDLSPLGLSSPRTFPARIDQLKRLTADVVEITLRTPPSSLMLFRAGQYIDVIGPTGARRSYSLANAPREDGRLTLQVRQVPGGELSHYWFETAEENDLLRIEGPLGTFCLRPKLAKHLILLATGTGIAPVRAILEELSESRANHEFETISLYWGGRYHQDLYWSPSFPSLALNFIPVLSRDPSWEGRTGYVQDCVIEDGHDLKDTVVYACGSENMISSARALLGAAGLADKQFYSDAFVSSS